MNVGVLQYFAWPDRRVPIGTVYERALERIERTGRTYAPRVVQVTGILLDSEKRIVLANSEGLFETEIIPYVTLYG